MNFLKSLLPWVPKNPPLFLYNSLTRRKEVFTPLKKGEVSLYTCGPTVYDNVHIGNLRTFLFADLLQRTLRENGYLVHHIINITDVGHLQGDGDSGDDKMMRALKRENKSPTLLNMLAVGERYAQSFFTALEKLNVLPPKHFPKASEHIAEDIAFIQKLFEKKAAYQTGDGIYFDTKVDGDYGKLGETIRTITSDDFARIKENPEKRDFRDFALWKFNDLGWDSPWGKGFPGWHIECSAMILKYLGETIDIHAGGEDLAHIHHNNEIAQSESAHEKPLARVFMHATFLTLGKERMAKSEGTGLSLKDIEIKGFFPLSFRYLCLTAHYRSPLQFTFEALEGADKALHSIYRSLASIPESGKANITLLSKFWSCMNDDLDAPKALTILFETLKSPLPEKDKLATILEFDKFFGLRINEERKKYETISQTNIPISIKNLLAERESARAKKDFARADALRAEIETFGFLVEDSSNGPKMTKK